MDKTVRISLEDYNFVLERHNIEKRTIRAVISLALELYKIAVDSKLNKNLKRKVS